MSKIYSRKRFILKPCRGIGGLPNGGSSKIPKKTFIIQRKTLKVVLVVAVAIFVYKSIMRYIAPVFETLCEDKVKSIATIISNQESTRIMNK